MISDLPTIILMAPMPLQEHGGPSRLYAFLVGIGLQRFSSVLASPSAMMQGKVIHITGASPTTRPRITKMRGLAIT
ncbi:hypothetical protein EON83_27280 [bacterium]|nr:MAG: hypothetical protein EON83_27280 [bacterium]